MGHDVRRGSGDDDGDGDYPGVEIKLIEQQTGSYEVGRWDHYTNLCKGSSIFWMVIIDPHMLKLEMCLSLDDCLIL